MLKNLEQNIDCKHRWSSGPPGPNYFNINYVFGNLDKTPFFNLAHVLGEGNRAHAEFS